MRKELIAIGIVVVVAGGLLAYSQYSFHESGRRPMAAALRKGLVTKPLERTVAQAAERRPQIIVAFERQPAKAYTAKALTVRAQEIRSLAIGLQAYGFSLAQEEILPLLGYAVGTAPYENIDAISRQPGVRAVAKNPLVRVGGLSKSTVYLEPEEAAGFHKSGALPPAENVVVCVVDSGAPRDEPWVENAMSARPGEDPEADFFHGAAVARVVHAVSPDARITSIKTLGPTGAARLSTILRGLELAATMKPRADVVNMSLGTAPGVFAPMDEASEVLSREYGMLVIAAAGNTMGGGQTSPATSFATVSVGALSGEGNEVAPYSASEYDVLAVGNVEVLALGRVMETRGTSFAAPVVSGLTARWLVNNPGADWSKIDAPESLRASVYGFQQAGQLPIVTGETLAATTPKDKPTTTQVIWPYVLVAIAGTVVIAVGLRVVR